MKILCAATLALVAVGLTTGAHATPVEKATALPFAVKLEWASSRYVINALRLDCRIHDAAGNRVGRGSFQTRLDPAFLSRRGTVEAVLPAVVYKGTDPDAGLTCSCRARFDTRSPFFRSGTSRFGQLPWMFARPYRFAESSCEPVPASVQKSS
ncbi:hypothetical protein [Minwuia sp.]|uniref:hypothetical protein n=1 Tax=Minwuia sp. TaxID=2493630 RepID=UPI003A940788